MSEPKLEQIALPPEYGKPARLVKWEDVAGRIEAAPRYWLATTRADGRPHPRPVDGVWLDGTMYFGGSPQTVWVRNLRREPRVSVHLEDGEAAVILEGVAVPITPDLPLAARLAEASNAKYGYGATAESMQTEVWTFAPTAGVAWNVLFEDATRLRF